jgi:hypothetical protein
MSRFDERVKPIPERAANLQAELRALSKEVREAADITLPGAIGRAEHVLESVILLATDTPAEMINQDMVDVVLQRLNELGVEIGAVAANPSGAAPGLEQQTETLVTATVAWSTLPRLSAQAGRQISNSVARNVEGTAQALKDQVVTLQRDVDAAAAEMVSLQAELQQQIAQADEQLKAKLVSLEAALAQERQRTDALTAEYQRQFVQAEAERRQEFETVQDELNGRAADLVAEFTVASHEEIRRLTEIREQAEAHADAVANTGTATAFGKDASRERKAADLWRYVAITLGLLAAAVAGILLLWRPFETGSLSAPSVVGRVTVALVLGALATYAGNQSSQHRHRDIRSRRLELELTAFRPFIEGLDETTKARLRTDFVERLFKGAEGTDAQGDQPALASDQITLLGNVADIFLKVLKAPR